MTVDEAQAIVASVTLGPCAIRDLKLTAVYEADIYALRLHWTYSALDSGTGRETMIHRMEVIPRARLEEMPRGRFVDLITYNTRELFLHEFYECLRVGGQLVKDPHANERRNAPSPDRTRA